MSVPLTLVDIRHALRTDHQPTRARTSILILASPGIKSLSVQHLSLSAVMSAIANSRANKATMHELKLRRLLEHNHRLREELARPRVMVSVASMK